MARVGSGHQRLDPIGQGSCVCGEDEVEIPRLGPTGQGSCV